MIVSLLALISTSRASLVTSFKPPLGFPLQFMCTASDQKIDRNKGLETRVFPIAGLEYGMECGMKMEWNGHCTVTSNSYS